MLASWTGHGAIVNSAAQRALALDLDAPVAGGWYGENDAGEFDGRLYEYAQWRLQALPPLLPDETVIADLRGYADRVDRKSGGEGKSGAGSGEQGGGAVS